MASVTNRRAVGLGLPPGSGPPPQHSASDAASRTWYRAHHPDNGPWWFATATADQPGGGRFDLPDPDGTCYIATDPEVAVRERLGHVAAGRPLTAAMLNTTAISVVTPPAKLLATIADVTVKAATTIVTREISVTGDYRRTRLWAQHWKSQGHTGIWYLPRFSTGEDARSLALFDAAGARKPNRRTERRPRPAADILAVVIAAQGGPVSRLITADADIDDT